MEARLVLRQWEGSQLPWRHHGQQAAADLQGRHRPLQHQVRLLPSIRSAGFAWMFFAPFSVRNCSWAAETLIVTQSRQRGGSYTSRHVWITYFYFSCPPTDIKGRTECMRLEDGFLSHYDLLFWNGHRSLSCHAFPCEVWAFNKAALDCVRPRRSLGAIVKNLQLHLTRALVPDCGMLLLTVKAFEMCVWFKMILGSV